MKRKCVIIGTSILAVVMVSLTSLTNVVGFQSVKSTIDDSPLFKTRTQRAINEEGDCLISNYLGKGLNQLSFPVKDNRTLLIKKIIDRIRTMDNKQFNRFQNLIVIWFYKQHFHSTDFLHLLNLIRQSSVSKEFDINGYDIIKNRMKPPTYIEYTCKSGVCLIDFLIILLVFIISESFYLIVHLFTLNQCQYGYLQ
jgi:hypothetical protein